MSRGLPTIPNIIDLAMRDVTNLDTHPRHFRDAAQS
jgi:hypothetical protein